MLADSSNCPYVKAGSSGKYESEFPLDDDIMLADNVQESMESFQLELDFRLADRTVLSCIRVDETVTRTLRYADVHSSGETSPSTEREDEVNETSATYFIDESDFTVLDDSMFSIMTERVSPTYTYELTSYGYSDIGSSTYYGVISSEETTTVRRYSFIGWKDTS